MAQKKFKYWNFPEMVNLATAATGLGIPLADFSFVEKNGRAGESAEWIRSQKGFLDQKALAYTLALAAWVRNDLSPSWATGIRADVRNPMKKALRFLQKTSDSFFRAETAGTRLLEQPQENWLRAAASGGSSGDSEQIIAMRQFTKDAQRTAEQASILVDKLRGSNLAFVSNAIWTTEQTRNKTPEVIDELRMLCDSPDNDVRAKAVMTLAVLGEMDEETINRAAGMLGSGGPYMDYAAAFSLSSLPAVPEYVLKPMNKGMLRALQGCDYGLVANFVAAFDRWVEQPEEYFAQVLEDEGPEYLEIVLETLDQNRNRFVQLSGKAG